MISCSILERSTGDIGLESVSLRLERHGEVRYSYRQREGGVGGREGGTHGDDVVDDLERGVAISELAVL